MKQDETCLNHLEWCLFGGDEVFFFLNKYIFGRNRHDISFIIVLISQVATNYKQLVLDFWLPRNIKDPPRIDSTRLQDDTILRAIHTDPSTTKTSIERPQKLVWFREPSIHEHAGT